MSQPLAPPVHAPLQRFTDRTPSNLAELERTLISDYLRGRGHDLEALRDRDDAEAHLLLAEASTYAATRLTEVESRAHYLHDLHRGAS